MNWRTGRELLKQSILQWRHDNVPTRAAAVAYYTMVSLAPLLVIVIALAGWALGDKAARGEIADQVRGLTGEEGGKAIEAVLESARKPGSGIVASVVGFLVLLFGAGGVFVELQGSLNAIWKAPTTRKNWIQMLLEERVLSFTMVLAVCFLLLVSLTVSAGVAAFGKWLGAILPGLILIEVLNVLISFLVITILFAIIFKYLPDVKISWSNVWMGAILTSVLFSAGKWLFGLYLGRTTLSSTYGAAGSLVVLLIWVYYSAQIFFWGAEFTHVYTLHKESQSKHNSKGSSRPTEATDKQQGPVGSRR